MLGHHSSAETRAKMSAAQKNRSPETRARMSAAGKVKVFSLETRAKMSAAAKRRYAEGRGPSPESRALVAAANTGRKCSSETRAKISAANMGRKGSFGNKGRKHSPEARARISAAVRLSYVTLPRKKASPKTRAKMSTAMKQVMAEGRGHFWKIGEVTRVSHGYARRGSSTYVEWQRWFDFNRRCYDPTNRSYKHYGAKGRTVCDAWRSEKYGGDPDPVGFERYLAHIATLGPCLPGMSLDRYPDPSGNYEPGNVRWATRTEQANNRVHLHREHCRLCCPLPGE